MVFAPALATVLMVAALLVGSPATPSTQVADADADAAPPAAVAPAGQSAAVVRLAGAGREQTAIAIAADSHPDGATTVVIARADDYPDALSGAPLAAQLGAPILLTGREGLSADVVAELTRLHPTTVVLLGGTGALSAQVGDDLAALGIADVQRYAGADRFATSRLIAEAVLARSGADEAYLALGAHPSPAGGWPDAVAVAGLAASHGRPVLLTAAEALPAPTAELVAARALRRVTVVGGTAAVPDAVADALRAAGPQVDRLAGESRFATSLAVAQRAAEEGPSPRSIWLATGAAYADALAAGPAVAADGGVLLLVGGGSLAEQPAHDWLATRVPEVARLAIVGGSAAVSAELEAEVRAMAAAGPEPKSEPAPAPPPGTGPGPEPLAGSVPVPGAGARPPVPRDALRVEVGDDLQDAIDAAAEGTTFVIASGTHRLQEAVPKDGMRFVGEPGAVLKGSRLLTAFTRADGLWVAEGQTQEGPAHGEMEAGRERDAHPEDLFLDGRRLRHVGARHEVRPGTWFFDYDHDRLYLGDDPAGRTAEVGVTAVAFSGPGVRDVTIENLVVSHYASRAQQGAINGDDTLDWEVASTEVSDNHGVGLRIGPGMHVHHSRALRNGQLGMGGVAGTRPALIESNEIAENRLLGYDWGWEGGGTKFVASTGLRFVNNWVHHNRGPGPWFDIDNVDISVASNLVEHNTMLGIFLEISYGADISSNTVRHNGSESYGDFGAGIFVSNSSDAEVHHNLLYGNRHEIMVIHDDRGDGARGEYRTTGLDAHHNDVTVTDGSPGLRAYNGDTTLYTSAGNHFRDNTWRLPDPDAPSFWWGQHLDQRGWRDIAGNDHQATYTVAGTPPTRLPAGATPFTPAQYGPRG